MILMVCFHGCYQMDHVPSVHVNFSNGLSRWSPNLTLDAWVIYSPSHELIHLNGVCVDTTTNIQVEYDVMIKLLIASLHLGIHHISVLLNSQILVAS